VGGFDNRSQFDNQQRNQCLAHNYEHEMKGELLFINFALDKFRGFKTSRRPPEFRRLLDYISPVTLVIAISLRQTSSALRLIDKSLRRQSNVALNFAAIIFDAIESKLVKKKSAVFCALRIIVFL